VTSRWWRLTYTDDLLSLLVVDFVFSLSLCVVVCVFLWIYGKVSPRNARVGGETEIEGG
jgi:hypothetical protein